MKTRIPKWLWGALAVCIPAGILSGLIATLIIARAPERQLALAFAKTNEVIRAIFGRDVQITDSRDSSSRIAFHTDHREGRNSFDIAGDKDRGTIIVKWERKSGNFRVTAVERYESRKPSHIIWKEE